MKATGNKLSTMGGKERPSPELAPAALFTEADNSKAIKSITSQQKRKSQLKSKVLKAIGEAF
jgi:hypothetical protein